MPAAGEHTVNGGDAQDMDFGALMGDVQPLAGEAPVDLKRGIEVTPGMLERRRAAEALLGRDPNFLPTQHIPLVDPHAELSFMRPGVQTGVFRKLRRGEYALDARLDLHGLKLEQARTGLWNFVRECLAHDLRSGLILHGRGIERKPPALLKSCVALWLPQLEEVLAFHSAPAHLGGTGATCVLLRKSERAKRENFEVHAKRRG